MDKFWMIVDVSKRSNDRLESAVIPEGSRPSFLHYIKGEAEKELLRLQACIPSGEFVMLESVAVAQAKLSDGRVLSVEPIN